MTDAQPIITSHLICDKFKHLPKDLRTNPAQQISI